MEAHLRSPAKSGVRESPSETTDEGKATYLGPRIGGSGQTLLEALVPELAGLTSWVAAISRRMKLTDSLDDLIQETACRALQAEWDPGAGTALLGTWLRSIATNVCRESRRRARRMFPPHQYGVTRASSDASAPPSAEYELAERTSLVRAVLDTLPGEEGQLLIEHHGQQLSCAALAAVSGKSPRAVRSSLHRARRRFVVMWCSGGSDRCLQMPCPRLDHCRRTGPR